MRTRWRTITITLALLAFLTGCLPGGSSDNPFVQKGQTQRSSSGTYTALLREESARGTSEYRPIITDASGATVWQNKTAFAERYFPGVAWAKDADVLWILSSDVGISRVERSGGGWVQTFGKDGLPDFLAKWATS